MLTENKKVTYCDICHKYYIEECPCDYGLSCPDLSFYDVDPYN